MKMNKTESFIQFWMCKGNPDCKLKEWEWSEYTRKTHRTFSTNFTAILIIGFIAVISLNFVASDEQKFTVMVAGTGVVGTILVAMTNIHFQNKQLQSNSMHKIFELLSHPDIRNARDAVHKAYCEMLENNQPITFVTTDKVLEGNVDKVLSVFDQVSVLVLNKLVDVDLFFDAYGEMIVRDWKTLEVEIKRRQHNNPRTLKHFTELKDRFENRVMVENKGRSQEEQVDTEPYCDKEKNNEK
jgi:hypothetical protein